MFFRNIFRHTGARVLALCVSASLLPVPCSAENSFQNSLTHELAPHRFSNGEMLGRTDNANVAANAGLYSTGTPIASNQPGLLSVHGVNGSPAPIPPQTVQFPTREKPGTIIVDASSRFLYFVLPGGRAIRYQIGVQRDGFQWRGISWVANKKKWPTWRPTRQMLNRRPDLRNVAYTGGLQNPLGARAIYIGKTLYRIHGTSAANTLGQPISSGCFRLANQDIIDLFDRVKVGSKIIVR